MSWRVSSPARACRWAEVSAPSSASASSSRPRNAVAGLLGVLGRGVGRQVPHRHEQPVRPERPDEPGPLAEREAARRRAAGRVRRAAAPRRRAAPSAASPAPAGRPSTRPRTELSRAVGTTPALARSSEAATSGSGGRLVHPLDPVLEARRAPSRPAARRRRAGPAAGPGRRRGRPPTPGCPARPPAPRPGPSPRSRLTSPDPPAVCRPRKTRAVEADHRRVAPWAAPSTASPSLARWPAGAAVPSRQGRSRAARPSRTRRPAPRTVAAPAARTDRHGRGTPCTGDRSRRGRARAGRPRARRRPWPRSG